MKPLIYTTFHCINACTFIHRNRRVPVDHPLPISSLPLYEKWKEEKYRNSSNRKGRVKNAQNYRCSDYRTAPTTLPLHSSPLLQKQSRPSRRDSPDSSLTFVNLSSPVYSDRTTGLGRRNIFSSESTNACRFRSTKTSPARGEESIDPLARSPKEYLSGCWSAAIYEPRAATLTSRAINLSTPQGSGERARGAYTHSASCNASILAATDVWIKAWLGGGWFV